MADPVSGAMIVGTGIQIYTQISAAQSQAAAQRREADMKNMQAQELESRQAINEQIMREKEGQAELLAFNDNGTTRGSLGNIFRLRTDLQKNIETSRREAEWKARMLRMGADADVSLASDVERAGYYGAAGTVLTSGAKIYGSYRDGKKPSTETKDLPGVSL